MADSERIGPYRVMQRLGAGGMGEVVLAHDDRLDRLVAIKRLHDDAAPERRERFRREARIVARLNHPAIVQIHDVLHEAGHDYLIMEYVEGQTLRARRAAGEITVSEVIAVAHQIALGMAAAHELGIIHRDLKSENVLLASAGRAKLTDFGIAKLDGDDPVTADGAVLGTFRAMSPEQALGHPVDHRSDLFSFGILLYEALAGESPFRADTPYLTVQRLVLDDPRPIGEFVPAAPPELARLIHQLLAKEPALRPRDFHEVAAALIEIAGEACDLPRRGDALGGAGPGDPRPTEDPRPTGDPQPTEDTAALGVAGERATPSTDPTRRRVAWRRRGRFAAALGLAALAALAALGVGRALRRGARLVPDPSSPLIRVAVLAPSTWGADDRPEVALLDTAVRNAIANDLLARSGLDPLPWVDVESYVDGVARATETAPEPRTQRAAVGADELVATHLTCMRATCRVTLERDPAAPGAPRLTSFDLAIDNIGHPAETIAIALSRLFPDHPARGASRTGALDREAYTRYVEIVRAYRAGGDELAIAAAIDEVDQLNQRSPHSVDVLLFEAEMLRHRSLQTATLGPARIALDRLEDADRALPGVYSILSARFDVLLDASAIAGAQSENGARLIAEAHSVLDRLEQIDPDSATTHYQRAKLRYHTGDLAGARAELDAAAERNSLWWRIYYYRALVLRGLDDRPGSRRAIDQLLALSPGNYGGRSLLARDELDSGHLGCAAQHYQELVARSPLFDECTSLGYTLVHLGRYREAADSLQRALAIRPDDPAARLNLAEALLLAGDTAEAHARLAALRELFVRKRRETPGGELPRADRLAEAQTLAYLGRDDPEAASAARARADELLAPTPRSDALCTAALVHAYLGDRDLAARYVTAYLDADYSPAEFSYPWFDDLRRDPVLGPRLAVSVARGCAPVAAP